MNQQLKQKLIAFCTFIGGAYYLAEYLLPKTVFGFKPGMYHDKIGVGVAVVGSMAIALGLINIFRFHLPKMFYPKFSALPSWTLIVSLLLTGGAKIHDMFQVERSLYAQKEIQQLAKFLETNPSLSAETLESRRLLTIRFLEDRRTLWAQNSMHQEAVKELDESVSLLKQNPPAPTREEKLTHLAAAFSAAENTRLQTLTSRRLYGFMSDAFFVPIGAAMFSLLAFYIASASFRSFRVRNLESGIMMLGAVIVIAGQIPQGALYISEDLPAIRFWFIQHFSTPAVRAVGFGTLVAGLSLSVRMWLSLQKAPSLEEDA